MPTAFSKFNAFVEHVAEGVHNLQTGALKVYLTTTTPNAATMAVKADLSETLTTTGGYHGDRTGGTLEQARRDRRHLRTGAGRRCLDGHRRRLWAVPCGAVQRHPDLAGGSADWLVG